MAETAFEYWERRKAESKARQEEAKAKVEQRRASLEAYKAKLLVEGLPVSDPNEPSPGEASVSEALAQPVELPKPDVKVAKKVKQPPGYEAPPGVVIPEGGRTGGEMASQTTAAGRPAFSLDPKPIQGQGRYPDAMDPRGMQFTEALKRLTEAKIALYYKDNGIRPRDVSPQDGARIAEEASQEAYEELVLEVGQDASKNHRAMAVVLDKDKALDSARERAAKMADRMIPDGPVTTPFRWLLDETAKAARPFVEKILDEGGTEAEVDEYRRLLDAQGLGEAEKMLASFLTPLALTAAGPAYVEPTLAKEIGYRKEGEVEYMLRASLAGTVAPVLFSMLDPQQETVKWNSPQHAARLQSGEDIVNYIFAPGEVMDNRLEGTYVEDALNLMGVPADTVIWAAQAVSGVGAKAIELNNEMSGINEPRKAVVEAARARQEARERQGEQSWGEWLTNPKERFVATADGIITGADAIAQLASSNAKTYEAGAGFTGGAEIGTGATRRMLANVAIMAPAILLDIDAPTVGLLGAGKAVSTSSRLLRVGAKLQIGSAGLRTVDGALEVLDKTQDVTEARRFLANYDAVVGKPIQQIVDATTSIEYAQAGAAAREVAAEVGTRLQYVRSAVAKRGERQAAMDSARVDVDLAASDLVEAQTLVREAESVVEAADQGIRQAEAFLSPEQLARLTRARMPAKVVAKAEGKLASTAADVAATEKALQQAESAEEAAYIAAVSTHRDALKQAAKATKQLESAQAKIDSKAAGLWEKPVAGPKKMKALRGKQETLAEALAKANADLDAAGQLIDPMRKVDLDKMTPVQLLGVIEEARAAAAAAKGNRAKAVIKLIPELNYARARVYRDNAAAALAARTKGATTPTASVKQAVKNLKTTAKDISKAADGVRKADIADSAIVHYRNALVAVRTQLEAQQKFLRAGGEVKRFNTDTSLTARLAGSQRANSKMDRAEFTKRFRDTYGMDVDPVALKNLDFRKLYEAERRAYYANQMASSRPRQAGALVVDDVAQQSDLMRGRLTRSGVAGTLLRVANRWHIRGPLGSLGVGRAPEHIQMMLRDFLETDRISGVELAQIAKNSPDGAAAENIMAYLFSDALVPTRSGVIQGDAMAIGNRISPPATRALAYFRRLALGSFEEFAADASVKGLASAFIPRAIAADDVAHRINPRILYDAFREGGKVVDEVSFREFIYEDLQLAYHMRHGEADARDVAAVFLAHNITHAANTYDAENAIIAVQKATQANPPDGVMAAAVDYITTRSGGFHTPRLAKDEGKLLDGIGMAVESTELEKIGLRSSMEELAKMAERAPEFNQAQALKDSLDAMQDWGTGVSSARVAAVSAEAYSVLGKASAEANAFNQFARQQGGSMYLMPTSVRKLMDSTHDGWIKKAEQYGMQDKMEAAALLDSMAAYYTRSKVVGAKFPRLAYIAMTTVGDTSQMFVNVDPGIAATVLGQTATQLLPGARAVTKALPNLTPSNKELDAILAGEQGVIRIADGEFTNDEMAAILVRVGMVDTMVSSTDALDLARAAAKQRANVFARGFAWLGQPSIATQAMTEFLEAAQVYTRGALFLELAKKHDIDTAGKIMRDTLIDWAGSTSKAEKAGLMFKLSAFWTYNKGIMNMGSQMVMRDLADLEAGRVSRALTSRTGRPLKAARIGDIPAEIADQEADARYMTGVEQSANFLETQRAPWAGMQPWIGSEKLPDGLKTRYQDAYGRRRSVASLTLAGLTTDHLLTHQAYIYGLERLAEAALDRDPNTVANWGAMWDQTFKLVMDNTLNNPAKGGAMADFVADILEIEKGNFSQSAESKAHNGVFVPPKLAGVFYDTGLADSLMVKHAKTGRWLWRSNAATRYGLQFIATLPNAFEAIQLANSAMDASAATEGPGEWISFFLRDLLGVVKVNELNPYETEGYKQKDASDKMGDLVNREEVQARYRK